MGGIGGGAQSKSDTHSFVALSIEQPELQQVSISVELHSLPPCALHSLMASGMATFKPSGSVPVTGRVDSSQIEPRHDPSE